MSDTEPPTKRTKIETQTSETKLTVPETNQTVPDNTTVPESNIDFTKDVEASKDDFVIDEEKYKNFVTPEEIEKLKEFKILDEYNEDDDSEEERSTDSEKEEEVPEEEIEQMLDADLPADLKAAKPKQKPYTMREKTVMEEKGVNQLEVLPLDWVCLRHQSGLPLYLHRPTRVATLARPYVLGTANTRAHDIPISAIPCLVYRRALEEEEKQKEIDRKIDQQIKDGSWKQHAQADLSKLSENSACPFSRKEKDNTGEEESQEKKETADPQVRPIVLPGGLVMPPPKVEDLNTSWKTQHLTPEQINEYARKLFKFKTIKIMHFDRWAERRKYAKARKALQHPALPPASRLISMPPSQPGQDKDGARGGRRDWLLNMSGGSYLSVFHEYVYRALKHQPKYEFQQLENASCPYQATVYIGGMAYGVGRGSSKRRAKADAAMRSIHVLLPGLQSGEHEPADLAFFDGVGVEDPRVVSLCAAACEPTPHAVLRTCLLRNFGVAERHIHTEMRKLEYQKMELTMTVGKHKATVVCKNKKMAKQRASQAILQLLHPHVKSWGSLLRLYGSRSVKSCKEKKVEEQQITLLQDKAKHNEPNYAVLEKLKLEMTKLRERDEAVVPIGTLMVTHDLPSCSGANLDNINL